MTEDKSNNKSQGDKEMWTLLNKIFDFIVGLPWKRFWEWLTHIPNIIKYLLVITILVGWFYLFFYRVYTRNNIQ